MKTIYKYTLDLDIETSEFQMPLDAEILCVQNQNNVLCLWVMFDEDQVLTSIRKFQIYGTGHSIPSFKKYIGTAQMGIFVWHVFEVY